MSPCAWLVAAVASHSSGLLHPVSTERKEEASISPPLLLPRADPQGPALVIGCVGAVIKHTWERRKS